MSRPDNEEFLHGLEVDVEAELEIAESSHPADAARTPGQVSRSLESKTGVDGPVTVIKHYTVPAGEAGYFVERYQENARIMAAQPGFVRSRLHRPLADAPEVRFVHIAEWSSGTALDKATGNPEWQASLQRMFDDPGLHITSEPASYRVVVELHPS
ncbi:MAG TPA: antibiotic biosynthesis monooxygenase family protein [Amycolatopsis sp.]|uniref:antibiotic biosynthesis monooxygenase family protein n=1 Tax=Amycolatopsis sp. TaxID=37632 RepID=UPI002F3E90AB